MSLVDTRLFFSNSGHPEKQLLLPQKCVAICCDLHDKNRFLQQRQLRHSYQPLLSDSVENLIAHDHGVWSLSNHVVAKCCREKRIRRVVSPRGMLLPWSMNHRRWKKRMAWWLYQYRDLKNAVAFHATSIDEAIELRRLGFSQPIAIVPNGVNLPKQVPSKSTRSGRRTVLFLSRIHEKKNLIGFCQAWADIKPDEEWRFLIAGPDEKGHAAVVRNTARSLGILDQIEFVGPVDDVQKWQLYVDADLTVLPTFSENFGITVAESLCMATPVITTTGTPWQELADREFGWWVAPDDKALAVALSDAISKTEAGLQDMGQNGQSWATGMFGWMNVAQRMSDFYRWLLDPNEPHNGSIHLLQRDEIADDLPPFGHSNKTLVMV